VAVRRDPGGMANLLSQVFWWGIQQGRLAPHGGDADIRPS
jgi:hypothetical protein